MVEHGAAWWSMVQHGGAWCSMVEHVCMCMHSNLKMVQGILLHVRKYMYIQ